MGHLQAPSLRSPQQSHLQRAEAALTMEMKMRTTGPLPSSKKARSSRRALGVAIELAVGQCGLAP